MMFGEAAVSGEGALAERQGLRVGRQLEGARAAKLLGLVKGYNYPNQFVDEISNHSQHKIKKTRDLALYRSQELVVWSRHTVRAAGSNRRARAASAAGNRGSSTRCDQYMPTI